MISPLNALIVINIVDKLKIINNAKMNYQNIKLNFSIYHKEDKNMPKNFLSNKAIYLKSIDKTNFYKDNFVTEAKFPHLKDQYDVIHKKKLVVHLVRVTLNC